jgi:hypothetical protein
MRVETLACVMLVLAFVHVAPVAATTIHVDVGGGGDYTTIGEGVAAASDGDTVLVAAGTYSGQSNRNLNFAGRNLVLTSEAGAENTIIDCEEVGRALLFETQEDSTSVVQGFTITRGHEVVGGGAIFINQSSPTILDCTFSNNGGIDAWNGGAVLVAYSTGTVLVSGCTFHGNTAEFRGAGVFCDNSTVIMRDCLFYGNAVTTSDVQSYHGGAGVCVNDNSAIMTNCTFVGNTASSGASGVHRVAGTVTVEDCILAFGLAGPAASGWLTTSHCVVFGNAGGDSLDGSHHDNLFVDPLLCGMASNDYTLCSDSPCLSGSPGNPWGELVGAFESGCGDCGSAVEPATWGRIKGLYR